ncbi:MAG: hypothetical protein D6690_03665 [Nitrospirae bacterium]|nr:MAG: hypothetical protein D6690_03665 [Nitrospirota bacterium]
MDTHIPDHHPLRRLFGTLTERSFAEALGWPDFRVTEYVSNLLVEFAHIDNLTRIKDQEGHSLETVVELLYEAERCRQTTEIDKERDVHRHIGDFTLFMAGLFPEYLNRIKCSRLIHHQDFLVDYVKAGKRSYGIVAQYPESCAKEPAALFQTLSTNFELCVAGLGFVRRDLDRMQDPGYRRAKNILLH